MSFVSGNIHMHLASRKDSRLILVLSCKKKKILADRYNYLIENKDLTAAFSKLHNLHLWNEKMVSMQRW